jgi:hypothetical protein
MSNGEKTGAARGQGSPNPVRTTAVIVYATLLLLILTIPQSLPNWLRDMEENPVQRALLRGAEALQDASKHMRLDRAYMLARAAFLDATGKQDQ